MSRERSAAFKRLIRKYEFLLEDWEDVSEISKSANLEMMREINLRKPADITENDFTVEESEEDEKEKEEETPEDRVLKKLFRKIVFKSHPDRLGDEVSELEKVRIVSLYDQAVNAHDDKNWALMVVTAIKLDVELPEEAEEMVDKIEDEARELEEKIANETTGIAWQFYHAVEEEKEKIIERYLAMLALSKKKKLEAGVDFVNIKGSKLILGVGHPRTGTGYTAKLLQSWGLDVGHEKMGEHGTVDWSLATGAGSIWIGGADFREWEWEHIIYCVRDPRTSIPSIVYTENVGKTSENFRKEMGVSPTSSKIGDAIMSIIKWDEYIRKLNPNLIFRIEDESKKLFDYLNNEDIDVKWDNSIIGNPQNTRDHKTWDDLIKEERYVGNLYKKKINRFCNTYGYDPLF
jgi:hypothetical protein